LTVLHSLRLEISIGYAYEENGVYPASTAANPPGIFILKSRFENDRALTSSSRIQPSASATSEVTKVAIASTCQQWSVPSAVPILGSNEVHVWRAVLDESTQEIDSFLYTLSADERTRAERFYFQSDRERFITAHGVLRRILGAYLNRAPECLSFCSGSHGKPALALGSGGDAIRFNMTHSHGVALYAVTRGREVGIDLEFIERDLEVEQIAERYFSRREIATLRALPTELRKGAFFLCWTRKEAYIKARGEGLSLPLDQFDVSLIPGQPAALLSTQPADEDVRWSLQELTVASGYVAALAVEGHGLSLSCWQWPGMLRSNV
jgi:4'-phosphopantetheinyl transferase